jgi:hypothetical protein
MSRAIVHGQGVASRCCSFLLPGAGFMLSTLDLRQPRVPALVVGQATQRLMADVFRQPDLFAGLPRIEQRMVAWGPAAGPVALPHSAIVISEEALLARLPPISITPRDGPTDWMVLTSGARTAKQVFGTRVASVVSAELNTPDANACWVESLQTGWLFLIPGWLISVGADPSALLSESRLVAAQIRSIGDRFDQFPAAPRIADPLCGPDWLACGASAMAFDPICGDGTGNAVREAILAAAVIRAAARGEAVDRLLAHYTTRLTAAFQKHLQMTLAFYRAGNSGPWWDAEIEALERGLSWCAGRLAAAPAFQYRLAGFDLFPISAG